MQGSWQSFGKKLISVTFLVIFRYNLYSYKTKIIFENYGKGAVWFFGIL